MSGSGSGLTVAVVVVDGWQWIDSGSGWVAVD
jgi:hypothetical protein